MQTCMFLPGSSFYEDWPITNYATTNTTIPRINHDITLFLVVVLHLLVLLFAIMQDTPPASYAYHHFPARVSGVHAMYAVLLFW